MDSILFSEIESFAEKQMSRHEIFRISLRQGDTETA